MEAELEKLRKENKGLKAICSIIKTSLAADCRYNVELLERLIVMQETDFGGFHDVLGWRRDSKFKTVDGEGEHDPIYVVTPNGEMWPFNHYNDATTDIARAQWVAQVLNDAWDKIRHGTDSDEVTACCGYDWRKGHSTIGRGKDGKLHRKGCSKGE